MAPPFFMASLRSASEDCREEFMASKAAEEGKDSGKGVSTSGLGLGWRSSLGDGRCRFDVRASGQ